MASLSLFPSSGVNMEGDFSLPQQRSSSGSDLSTGRTPTIFDIPSPFPKDDWPPHTGGWSPADAANTTGNLMNWAFSIFSGLTPQVGNLYNMVLSGQLPQVAQQLMDPVMRQVHDQVMAAMPQQIRQANDTLQGGSRAQAVTNALQATFPAMAQADTQLAQSLYSPLVQGAMNLGAGLPQQLAGLAQIVGLIRTQDAQAKAVKKSSGGGGLFK